MKQFIGSLKTAVLTGLVATLVIGLFSVYAADPEPPAAPRESEESASPKPKKKNKYQRSKLTHDESEALADKRRLLLTTGEDRLVDLDFEPNLENGGITAGNPQIVAPI